MTPDLMEDGERRARAHREHKLKGRTHSGGRAAGFCRPVTAGEVDVAHGRILYLEDVSVSFDGFKAINGLSLDIAPGELRCIIGPNGAGKTTLMDIITGKTRPDAGTVFFGSTIDLLRYTEPELAWVGKTEAELKAAGIPYKVGTFPFAAIGRAVAMNEPAGMVKLIAHAETDRLLGAHMVGVSVSELIHETVVTMEFKGAADDLARICHAHPTLSEAVHEAALAVDKRAIHKAN
jgi:hypothetical protein